MSDSDGLTRRCRIGLRAWETDRVALHKAWPYLPRRLKECHIRSYYVAKLMRALGEDNNKLAELLGEIYRLGE
jgi:hypothetical protein